MRLLWITHRRSEEMSYASRRGIAGALEQRGSHHLRGGSAPIRAAHLFTAPLPRAIEWRAGLLQSYIMVVLPGYPFDSIHHLPRSRPTDTFPAR